MIVRVVPNVTGLDKRFDYRVAEADRSSIEIGTMVRVDLHGRRIGGWVVEIDPSDAFGDGQLSEVRHVTGRGPTRDLIEVAEWAAVRWAGRLRHFLQVASPPTAIKSCPPARRNRIRLEPTSPATDWLLELGGGGVVCLPPTGDVVPTIASAITLGPVLVVAPAIDQVALLAARLRRAGLSVAEVPRDWAAACGGVDVVIGTRSAVWAPCPEIAAAVLIDEHDERLQEEASPTWHARDVMIERCRTHGVPVIMTSAAPSLSAIEWANTVAGVRRPPPERMRRGWPTVEVIDRSEVEPWKRSLLSSQLIQELTDHERVVVCVSNTPGRARLLACRHCRSLARCERCDAAVELAAVQTETGGDTGVHRNAGAQSDTVIDELACRRCGTRRPQVCLICQHSVFANVRPGVGRLVEEVAAAAGRDAILVQGSDREPPPPAGVYVGTEAVLHRVDRVDTIAFLEFDRELLAPRYRANEQAMALLLRAARLVGPQATGGRLLIQTFLPDHPVLQAALSGDTSGLEADERNRRQGLSLPPYAAYAEISGAGADEFVATVPRVGVQIVGGDDDYVAKSAEWITLGTCLSRGVRPPGARLRIAVDPPR